MKYYEVIFTRESLTIIVAAKNYIISHAAARDDIVNVYMHV